MADEIREARAAIEASGPVPISPLASDADVRLIALAMTMFPLLLDVLEAADARYYCGACGGAQHTLDCPAWLARYRLRELLAPPGESSERGMIEPKDRT